MKDSASAQIEAWRAEWCTDTGESDKQTRLTTESPFHNNMQTVASHLALLILSKGPASHPPQKNQEKMERLARRSLEFLLDHVHADARYIVRTVCAMISWNAVVYLKASGAC